MPEASVITSVRNGERFIRDTISSIRHQTFDDWEYIVVDDASTDSTISIVEDEMREDPRIRLIRRTTSGGPYAAANDGLREARGRCVVRIDADDVAVSSRIERQVLFLGQTGLRACASHFREMTSEGKLTSEVGSVSCGVRAMKWRLCVRHGLTHSSACVERSAFEEIGGYRSLRASQDLRMWCDLARRDWLGVVPEVLVHLRRPGGITSADPSLQEQLAFDAVADHIAALSPDPWSRDEIRALRPTWTGVPIRARLDALERWRSLWRSDPDLSRDDWRDLRRLERRVYLDMARQALRWEGPSALPGIAVAASRCVSP
ncbi:MAG: glycosyltransferase family 2 protein [Vicinamibacterales bacterium]